LNPNNNNKDDNREIASKVAKFGAIVLGSAIILACFAYAKITNPILQITIGIIAAIIGCLGIFLLITVIYSIKASGANNNFFLYDKKKKQNIPISELTVAEIRMRLFSLMSIFKYKGKLYIGDLFSEDKNIPECFRTLFCYELLCEISEKNCAEAEIFLSFGNECANIFYKYLSENADYDLARDIKIYINDFSSGNNRVEEFHKYIISKKQQIEEKMLIYTVENIDKFY